MKSLGISEHLEICKNGREILQKCRWNFIDPRLKVGMVRRAPGDSGEFLGEEIFRRGDLAKHHCYSFIRAQKVADEKNYYRVYFLCKQKMFLCKQRLCLFTQGAAKVANFFHGSIAVYRMP